MNQEFNLGFKRPPFGDVPWVLDAFLVLFPVLVEVSLILSWRRSLDDDYRPSADPASGTVQGGGISGQNSRIL